MCIGIIWNNSFLVGGHAQAEARIDPWPLRTSRSTAHGAQVVWPLDYMGRASTAWECYCNTHSNHHTHHNRFTTLFPGPSGWAGARRELLNFMVQGKVNRGRHTDHPAKRHSIRTNQCPPPPSPHFLQTGCPSCCPTNSVKALEATTAFGLGRWR